MLSSMNITDEEKEQRMASFDGAAAAPFPSTPGFNLSSRPFLESLLNSLEATENDYSALFALCLISALMTNKGTYYIILSGFRFSKAMLTLSHVPLHY